MGKNNPAPTFCAPNKDSINDKTEFNQLVVTLSQRRLFSYNGYRRAIGSHRTFPTSGNELQEGQKKVNKRQPSHVPASWNPAVCPSDQASKGHGLKHLDRWRENNFYTSDLQNSPGPGRSPSHSVYFLQPAASP